MRTTVFGLILALGLAYSACSATAETQGVLQESLKLRKAPSLKAVQTGTLKAGARVTILDPKPSNGFYHVRISKNREGWVWAKGVKPVAGGQSGGQSSRKLARPPQSRELEPHKGVVTTAAAACANDLASCPVTGCASPPDGPHGIMNQLKQTVPSSTTATVLTFDDFASLQQQAHNTVGEDRELTADDRAQLKGLTVTNGQVSEGDLVSLLGYLVGTPHPNTGESVNCNLKGEPNNDYHIPFSNDPNNSDFQGIVVEMIPQNRPAAWNLGNLTQAESNQQLVMVTGGLFYDNLHKVNADPSNPERGQPHRFALWEIHPITQFMVCTKADNTCDPTQAGDWAALGGGQ
ncbi:MAG TPA: SH3 domain-containing protein [Terriglobales bacterium]|nr:SH3 domain-containing protein [Terriglobales bacterium]